jgi:hypothetical protein
MGLRRDMLLRQNRDAPARAADVKVHEHAGSPQAWTCATGVSESFDGPSTA